MDQKPNSPSAPVLNVRALYDHFDAPVAALDCGQKCAPYNPSGKPFCCDICHAVPAVYRQEWGYLKKQTDLWHEWRGDECPDDPDDPEELRAETPAHMQLLACKGPAHCQREYRAISCRQFPFFPYINSAGRFIGLAYEWFFEPTCWVISNLGAVSDAYRQEFIRIYDTLLATWPQELESYVVLSEQMRETFTAEKRYIPLLHRNGAYALIHPKSERLHKATPEQFPRFGPYQEVDVTEG